VAVLHLVSPDSAFALGSEFLTPGSERVELDSTRILQRGRDYSIQYRQGLLSLHRSLLQQIHADSGAHVLTVSFQRLPFNFRSQYSLHDIVVFKDTLGRTIRKVETPIPQMTMNDVFGPGLEKSGSIFRGLLVGSNRDLTVNSGFRMQLSGKLSPELDIAASLTDENVPLQPEGTTQTLQELDRVFIQLKNPRYGATLGDFVYDIGERSGGEFGRLSRKLQGVSGTGQFKNIADEGSALAVTLTAATARGKFTTNQMQGIEGNQGPYRLTGGDPGNKPIIIAGTERVYINGQLMTRGETNDYSIDYSTGDIYFSARRLITNASRITVDFEYTDRQFVRNLLGANVNFAGLGNRLHVTTSLTQEADDPDSPIDVALDDSLRSIIRESGANRFKAAVTGIRDMGRDSITLAGKGQYVRRDTLLAGKLRTVLIYAPGDVQARYSVFFSSVIQMPPDSLGYNRGVSGGYVVAGIGKGSYLPVQFLPVPELHRVANGILGFSPASELLISAEYALSEKNLNRLSGSGDGRNQGGAYKFRAEYNPRDLVVAGTHLGELRVALAERFVDHRFSSLDRSNEIEFNRAWDITSAGSGDEEIRELGVSYLPVRTLRFEGTYGFLERKGSFRSDRSTWNAVLSDTLTPKISYSSEFIRSQDSQTNMSSDWMRQRGSITYAVFHVQPSVRVELENRQQHREVNDSLVQGSFRYLEVAPGLTVLNLHPLRVSAEVQFRTEDSASQGEMSRALRAVTQVYDVQLRQWNSLSGAVALSLRKSDVTNDFALRGTTGANTMLIRSQLQYTPLRRAVDAEILYEFARDRSAAMRRIFVRVPKGTGNYRYLGDVNQNGVVDDSEFEQTRFDGDYVAITVPGDQLVPVADLRAGMRLRLNAGKYLTQKSSFLEKALTAVSTETVLRVEEKSTVAEAKKVYLLHLSEFRNDSTTIAGSQLLTQDVYLFESDPAFSVRLRLNERKGLVQLVGTTERSTLREQSVRIKSQLLREIGNQTEYTQKADQLFSSVASPRQRDLVSDELRTEFSYRPYPEWDVSFGAALSDVTNRNASTNVSANINEQFVRVSYALLARGQLRAEVQREEVLVDKGSSTSNGNYPFEFTNGKAIGKTYQWHAALDYRMSQFIQLTFNYDGRSEGGSSAVHTARAEARAYF
jgi:hypothetical protein